MRNVHLFTAHSINYNCSISNCSSVLHFAANGTFWQELDKGKFLIPPADSLALRCGETPVEQK